MVAVKSLVGFTGSNKLSLESSSERFASSQAGADYLGDFEAAFISHFGLEGKSVVQLACDNGREVSSIKNLGAKRAMGFDIFQSLLKNDFDIFSFDEYLDDISDMYVRYQSLTFKPALSYRLLARLKY